MRALRRAGTALAALALTSCAATMPVFMASDPATTARVNMKSLGSGWLCANRKSFRLRTDSDGYAQVPAGLRITVGRYFSSQSGNMVYSCNTALSFVPVAGASYYANFEIAAERCRIEIYREGAKNRIGLSLEPTIGPSSCVAS